MLEKCKQKVWQANLDLVRHHLVLFTWGNVSGRDEKSGYIVIKPSGVPYETLQWEDMVVVSPDGEVVEGRYRPSSDTPTHLELYRMHDGIGGVVHTHSTYATAYAQAGEGIPAYGTTHADYFHGEIPCTRSLTEQEVRDAYERNTGAVIRERFIGLDPLAVPACLVRHHGVFAWGKDCAEAVYHAAVVEEVAKMSAFTRLIRRDAEQVEPYVLEKHYQRKHGANAYYGQK